MDIDGVTIVADVANAHYGGEEVPEVVLHPETGEEIASIGYVALDGWREATGVYGEEGALRSVADITDEGSLAKVREYKKAMKAAAKEAG